jgi:hypothetical protein
MFLKPCKVTVGVEEWDFVFDAPCGDHEIDGTARGDAFGDYGDTAHIFRN